MVVAYESRTARAKFLSQPRMEWYIYSIMKVYFPLIVLLTRSLVILFCYIDTSVLLENILLVKFIKTTSETRVVYFP